MLVPPCSHRSVETHRASIFSKLKCANDNELGRWLAAHPWLDQGELENNHHVDHMDATAWALPG